MLYTNQEGKLVAALASYKGEGSLAIANKEGKLVADLGSDKGEGKLYIYNKHGKRIATLQANQDSDGVIALFDRYGDFGWSMTGKK